MLDTLLLLAPSGTPIPFPEAQITIHNPSLAEISLIGEEAFFSGCQLLKFSKDLLDEQDKTGLEDKTDFDILMSIVQNSEGKQYKNYFTSLLCLLFPEYQIKFMNNEIILFNKDFSTRINNTNFNIFKDIVIYMFNLQNADSDDSYNPADSRASKIAEKLKKGKKKVAENNGTDKKKVAVFSLYVSILAVGEHKDLNELMNYTVFQIQDEFQRFQKKQSYDIYIQAKMAGAQDLDEIDNWMEDIHP